MRFRLLLICSLGFTLISSQALAVGILGDFLTITQEGAGSMTLSASQLGCVEREGTFTCDGVGQTFVPANPSFTWELSDWNITGEFDPFVSSAFGFKNTGATAVFTIVTTIPVAPIGPGSLMGGSTGGSVTDSNSDGLGGLSTVAPSAFFTGMVDGVPLAAAELLSDPTSVAFLFAGHTASIPAVFFGLPGPTAPGPSVAASIGIQNKFSLTGGDSIASSNFFVVDVVPEPSTALLLGIGLAAVAARQRSPAR